MQEHIIVRLLTRIFDFLLLNVLWVLCSIPVISLGASTTALMIGAVVWSMIGVSLIVYANSLLLRRMFCPYE